MQQQQPMTCQPCPVAGGVKRSSCLASSSGEGPAGQPVRYRGQVRDMLNPEYYRDEATGAMRERKPLLCVPVEGENQWASPASTAATHTDDDVNQKRRRLDPTAAGAAAAGAALPFQPAPPPAPHVDVSPPTCLLVFPEEVAAAGQGLRLNDVVSVLGELRHEPPADGAGAPVAVIHVTRVLEKGRAALAYPSAHQAGPQQQAETQQQQLGDLPASRGHMIRALASSLGGDQAFANSTLAAEYLLLHLLSHCTHDPVLVGKHCLNLSGIAGEGHSQAVAQVEGLLRLLMPRTRMVPVSLRGLNEKPMWPRKCYVTDALVGGPLLLSGRTHLVLDETQLGEGQLNACGVHNFQCLRQLVQFQTMEIDYQYYKLPIRCDVPALVLSHTKSILPCDTHLRLSQVPAAMAAAAAASPHAQQQQPPPSSTGWGLEPGLGCSLETLRGYLSFCLNHCTDYCIPQEVGAKLQEDFVQRRQKDPTHCTADWFHRQLTLARLLCQSHGEKKLSLERWHQLQHMEALANQPGAVIITPTTAAA